MPPTRSLLRARDVIISSLVYFFVALCLTRFPLFNVLGYEAAFVFSFVASFVGGFAAIGRIRRIYAEPELHADVAAAGTLRAARQTFLSNLVPLSIPFVVLLVNAFFVRNCSLLEGILFFVLLPVVSSIFATAVGFFCAVHNRFPRHAFLVIVFLSLAYDVAIGYWTPAIFSYNFFYGYFPGFTYDEGLRVTTTVLSFRIATIGLAAVFVWLGYLIVTSTDRGMTVREKRIALLKAMMHQTQRGLAVIIVALGVALFIFRCDLGYEGTSGFIRDQLGGILTTEHFSIYYPRGAYSPEELSRLADEHEFRYAQILESFHLQRTERVESFIYPSAEAKLRLIGAGNTDIAKPWTRQVHLTMQTVQSSLKHELIHVLAGIFGVPVVHASLSPGLTEGLPMAIEWSYGARTLHDYSAAMMHLGIAPDMTLLMSPWGFFRNAPSVSYVMAGSFCRYVIDRYGIRSILQVYGGASWEAQYGRPLSMLVADWKASLAELQVDEADLHATEVLFREPSVFARTCARVVGEQTKVASRAFASGEYAKAESLYAVAYEESGSLESLSGRATAALRRGSYAAVTAMLDDAEHTDQHPARLLSLALIHGDALWAQGEREGAMNFYHALRMVDLTDSYTEAAGVRFLAVRDDSVQAGYVKYFLFTGPDSLRCRMLDSMIYRLSDRSLLRYLRGRVALRMRRYVEAMTHLSSCSLADEDPILEAFRIQSMGIASYQMEDYAHARVWFWTSLNYDDSEASENGIDDWIQRCEWKIDGRGQR